jgi:hypothetical protein
MIAVRPPTRLETGSAAGVSAGPRPLPCPSRAPTVDATHGSFILRTTLLGPLTVRDRAARGDGTRRAYRFAWRH